MELISLNVSFASQYRKMRDLVSTHAATQYIERLQENAIQSETKVLVVIPCFNEEDSIESLVSDLEHLRRSSSISIEYCLVNDGSTDSTWGQMQRFSSGRCVNHLTNINVAGVLLTGFKIVRQLKIDFVVQCDGDGQHPVNEIESLVDYALQERADLVVGSRFLQEKGNYSSTTRMRLLGSRLIHCVIRVLWRDLKIYDPTSGFRVFSKRAYKVLIEKMPDEYPEPETLAVLKQENLRIVEKAVTMNTREFGTSSISGFKSLQFMLKVLTALFGFRIRGMF